MPKSNNDFAFGFYLEVRGEVYYDKFRDINEAHHFLLIMIAGRDYKWDVRHVIANDKGEPRLLLPMIKIWGNGIEDAIEYEPTHKEEGFVFPEPHSSKYARWSGAMVVQDRAEGVSDDTTSKPSRADDDKPQRTPKAPRAHKPEGLVSIADIAAELKTEPRIARGILRDTKTTKPEHGWAWSKADAAKITTIVKKGLAALAKKGK